jgi:hypothetical protein
MSGNWYFPLIAHKAGVRTFDLSSGMGYVSMKDQVVRATALVNCLIRCDIFKKCNGDYDVVVVGAGVAGVSAACYAAGHKLKVLVLESAEQLFPLQRDCHTRYVSFSMYDWPEAHANEGVFPHLNNLPVKSKAGTFLPCKVDVNAPATAASLVEKWTTNVGKITKRFASKLEWVYSATVQPPTGVGRFTLRVNGSDPVSVKYKKDGITSVVETKVLIFATGIGLEQKVPDSKPKNAPHGPPDFWSDMESPPWEDIEHTGKRVVIAGAGDGAIQDFLLVVFRERAANLLALVGECGLSAEQRARIVSAERHVMRLLMWNTPSKEAFGALQTVIDSIVDEVLVHTPDPIGVLDSIQKSPYIDWIASDSMPIKKQIVFSKCYSLNRFLATLTLRVLKNKASSRIRVFKNRLNSVHASGKQFICCLDGKKKIQLTSDYRPLIRLGIDRKASLSKSESYSKLRMAMASVPLPFKPADFPVD